MKVTFSLISANEKLLNLCEGIKIVKSCLLLQINQDSKHPKNDQPCLTIAYCNSLLRGIGYKTGFRVIKYRNDIESSIEGNWSYCVIKSDLVKKNLLKELVSHLNKDGVKVICFGNTATKFPKTLFDVGVDYCIPKKVEWTLIRLLSDLEKGLGPEAPSLVSYNSGFEYDSSDLNEFPFPDAKDYLDLDFKIHYPTRRIGKKKWGFILSSRGCGQRCRYCSQVTRVSWGEVEQRRSIENILDEIKYLISLGIDSIYFIDDNFISNKNFVTKLCNSMIEHDLKIRWVAQTRLDLVDPELLKLMSRAGCDCLAFGIESGSDLVLKDVKREMTTKVIREKFAMIKDAGMKTVSFFILGLPDETDIDLQKTVQLIKQLKIDVLQIHFFSDYSRPESCFTDKIDYRNIPSNSKKREKLSETRKKLYRRMYISPNYIFRNYKFLVSEFVNDPKSFLRFGRFVF